MREFFRLFVTDRRWFLGTLAIIAILYLFTWRIVDRDDFVITIGEFFHDLLEIGKGFLILAIMCAGVGIMFGWKPFKKKGNGH